MIFYNEGASYICQRILEGSAPENDSYVLLFVNDVTPAYSDGWTTYTGCTLTGGDPKHLTGAWTKVVASGGFTATVPEQTWTLAPYAGGVTIYGYLVYNGAGGVPTLLFGERFGAPFVVPAGGGQVRINITWPWSLCP